MEVVATPFCDQCGKAVPADAAFCPSCGRKRQVSIESPPPPSVQTASPGALVTVTESKNPGVAALLAFFVGIGLFGIGHVYVGRIGRGLVLLVISIVIHIPLFLGFVALPLSVFVSASAFGGWFIAVVFFGLVNLALWVWQTYDAYKLAKQFNAHVQQHGKAPW